MLSTFLLLLKISSISVERTLAGAFDSGHESTSATILPSGHTYLVLQATNSNEMLNNNNKTRFITPTTLFRYINLTANIF